MSPFRSRPVGTPSSPRYRSVHVVVPAHDEERHLDGCLEALAACADRTPVPVTVTVVLDSCTDGTAGCVHGRAEVVVVDERCVGAARAAGFRPVLDDAGCGEGLWLATTDADSTVPPDWLERQLARAESGAEMVVGLVRVADWGVRTGAVRRAYEQAYRSVDGHDHVHGANLGFSARAYRQLGGFAPLACDEDVDLVRRARAVGLRLSRSAEAPVATSARDDGRAPGGFCRHLDQLVPGDAAGMTAEGATT